jgi:hypothetical protein
MPLVEYETKNKFKSHYPEWDYQYNLEAILAEIFESMSKRVA